MRPGSRSDSREIGRHVAAEGRSIARGFVRFLLRGKVVDLAVAVVIGAAAGTTITAFVKDIFTPIVGGIFGSHADFSGRFIAWRGSDIRYGDFINELLSFLVIAAVIYFFVITPTNRLVTNAYFEPPPDPAMRKCPECLSDVPRGAKRCMYCAQPLEPLVEETPAALD
ncbi:MAG: large conductance mechanosensitive channel protein MscL [Vulcanimicrobiaceae bacterium]